MQHSKKIKPPLRTTQGRVVEIRALSRELQISLLGSTGLVGVRVPKTPASPEINDLVEWDPKRRTLRILTKNTHPSRGRKLTDHVLNPRRLHAMEVRRRVEQGIRAFFEERNFWETRTPLLVPCPGMEPHIRVLSVSRSQGSPAFLPTSPEFAMKRLLVGGLPRIFQICPAFRDEPVSRTHSPEFTMLEWYRANAGYEQIQADAEALVEYLAKQIFGKPVIAFEGRKISVKRPWPRLTIRKLFEDHVGIDLTKNATRDSLAKTALKLKLPVNSQDTWDDLFFKIWLNEIEPRLPQDRAVFVTRYPESQAALSVVDTDPDGSRWSRRFEIYLGGIELANAFEELTDPIEQRARFVKDMTLRRETYGPSFPVTPIDEGFIEALQEGMPPSGGIALGVDRLVMLLADEPDLQYTQWLPPI